MIRKPVHVRQLTGHVRSAPLALVGVEGAPPVAHVLEQQSEAIRYFKILCTILHDFLLNIYSTLV